MISKLIILIGIVIGFSTIIVGFLMRDFNPIMIGVIGVVLGIFSYMTRRKELR